MKYQVQENSLTIFLPREVDHHAAEELKREVDEMIERNHIKIVIFDFQETDFMDSSGIGVLAGRYRKISCFGGKVYVIHANRRIRKILEMSGIGDIVEMIDQEEKIEKQ